MLEQYKPAQKFKLRSLRQVYTYQGMQKAAAEFLGTFGLVFAGTGAIVVNANCGGVITHVGVALTFGLVVLAMIHAFGDVSGAHLNPAVTLAFCAAGRFPWRATPAYLLAQTAGALAASGVLRVLFPQDRHLGATLPSGTAMQSFVMELIMTFFLMLVILSVTTGANEKGLTAGISIGSVIALEALFGGPVSGASMNPVRSLAPAVVSGHLTHLWLYLAAPVLGALLAIPCCQLVRGAGCCSTHTPSCPQP